MIGFSVCLIETFMIGAIGINAGTHTIMHCITMWKVLYFLVWKARVMPWWIIFFGNVI